MNTKLDGLWQHSVENFIRRARHNRDEVVTRVKAVTTNNNGLEIACYAEGMVQLEGLKRLHVHAIQR